MSATNTNSVFENKKYKKVLRQLFGVTCHDLLLMSDQGKGRGLISQ